MSAVLWQEHLLPLADLHLAWYVAGTGPALVFVNGGPGDSHRYLRPVAAPLAAQYRCILYDQRGCGESRLDHLDAVTTHVDRFVEDLEALRRHFGEERLLLVGHSWGATLALLYAVAHPDHVARLALVGMGPIDEAMDAVADANLLKPLSTAEREERARLRTRIVQAVDAGNHDDVQLLRRQEAPLSLRAWFATPNALQRFLATYLDEEPTHRPLNRLVSASYRRVRPTLRYERVTAPTLILYGYQDFEPITQAFALRGRIPQAQLCFLNDCGHVPWLERPDAFYQALTAFLRATDAPTEP